MFRTARFLAAALLLATSAPALGQTVTVTTPNTVNPAGQPTAINKTFIVNSDGTLNPGTAVRGAPSIATAQVSVGTSATLLAAARSTRYSVTVAVGAANACAFGPAGITLTTGYLLQPVAGAADTSHTTAALYGVCSATTTISVKELF